MAINKDNNSINSVIVDRIIDNTNLDWYTLYRQLTSLKT